MKRRKKRSRASLQQQHKLNTLPKHPLPEETDDDEDSSEQAEALSSSRCGDESSLNMQAEEDFSHWDPSPKKNKAKGMKAVATQQQKQMMRRKRKKIIKNMSLRRF